MKTLLFLVGVVVLRASPALPQQIEPPDGTTIASAEVSGIDPDRFSPGLRDAIAALAGTALDRQALKDLAGRIETEQPRYVAAVRVTGEPDGHARVVFVAARQRDPHDANVNARYTVEDVEIRGVPEDQLPQALRDDLHALSGKPLDSDEVAKLETRLTDALPDYDFSHRTVKGSQPGRVTLVLDAKKNESARWLPFEPLEANGVYHSEQGWGAVLQLTGGGSLFHVTATIPIDNADDLIEEYSGFGLSFDTRKIGTERLGAFFEWSTYDQSWRGATVTALALNPQIPALYRNRMSVTPLLKFAVARHVSLAGGVNIAELDELGGGPVSHMANAAIGSVRFTERSRSRQNASPEHDADASVTVRAGTRSLQSDLVYTRYLAQADYSFRMANHRVLVSSMAGHITGAAPMFERFSLGDSKTLRGWDKYAITPVGGDRMLYGSLEYRYHDVGMFVDTGSVWTSGTEARVRVSTGVTYAPGPVFFTVGFPLNTNQFGAVFTMGYRYGNSALRLQKQ
jgi:hypothetical protein